ncbi:uncharacterized protein C1orf198 homolog [Aphidius gifuensis]|uniref:uncharacterized protein C1orf198 homolog n=1 Tax=Aphidius gifuensis TaxID=684658 RepID=UPI001CDD6D3B|nr:uncharacterized protein C1orf198 homolog [Aphidius gifuensis]
MSTKSMSSCADDYFFNINTLARRIGDDIESTKDAYEGLWSTLSLTEKNQAIDEIIIQPEVAIKYTIKNIDTCNKDLPEWYPKLRIQTGLKHVIDETGSTLRWRDEHSGPFSFMTRSQMNLSILDNSDKQINDYDQVSPHFTSPIKIDDSSFDCSLTDYSPSSNQTSFYQSESYSDSVFKTNDTSKINDNTTTSGNIFTKLMNKTSLSKNQNDDMESLVPQRNIVKTLNKNVIFTNNKNQINNNINARQKSGDINETTNLLDSSSSHSSFQSSQTTQDDGIPKTGFEFLDNW